MTLTRTQCAAMRGIAILGIMLHNFSHWLSPMVKENEYQFISHNVRWLTDVLMAPDQNLPVHLLSFFGHYGVPVFVFLSAWGLVMKYESASAKEENGVSFFASHYRKLWTMMVIGYGAFVLVDYMTRSPRHYEFWNVVGQLGMFSNLYADPDHDIWPGPYWYFGLMVQIYLVYRFVLFNGKGSLCGIVSKNVATIITWTLMIVPLVAQLAFEPEGMALQWYRYNVFGSLPVFVFGLLMARATKEDKKEWGLKANIAALMASLVVMVVGSLTFETWTLVPFAAVTGTVALVKCLPGKLMEWMVWTGGISSALFVCHPIARKILIPIAYRGDIYAGLLLYTVAAIVLALIFKKIRG